MNNCILHPGELWCSCEAPKTPKHLVADAKRLARFLLALGEEERDDCAIASERKAGAK